MYFFLEIDIEILLYKDKCKYSQVYREKENEVCRDRV